MAETIIAPVQEHMAAELGLITADMGMIVTRAARRFGSKTALVAAGRMLTYQALDDLVTGWPAACTTSGCGPATAFRYSSNRWEWVVAYHAALRVGAVVNPIKRCSRGRGGLRPQRLRRRGHLHLGRRPRQSPA